MKPSAFEMHRPRELGEALELLERFGDDARLIAGGQSLVPMMNLRIATPAVLIDLNAVGDLVGIRRFVGERGGSAMRAVDDRGGSARGSLFDAEPRHGRRQPRQRRSLIGIGSGGGHASGAVDHP
jgi:molybdopterin-dependent oxidoreductase-like protein